MEKRFLILFGRVQIKNINIEIDNWDVKIRYKKRYYMNE